MNTTPSFRLHLLGTPSLTGPDGQPLGGRATQRHRLALLALLGRSLEAGVNRDMLLAYLWPEADAEQARNLLKVSVYVLRQALGEEAIVSNGALLRLNPTVVEADVALFESAVASGEGERAISLYGGPFLEGLFVRDSPEFERWVDRERARLADARAAVLERLASDAEAEQRWPSAVEWWKARAAHDPYDSRVALRLMQALVAVGNRGGAVRHARVHARLLADELGIEPSPEVGAFAARLHEGAGGIEMSDRGVPAETGAARLDRSAGRLEAPAIETPAESAPVASRQLPEPAAEPATGSATTWRQIGFWGAAAAALVVSVLAIVTSDKGVEPGPPSPLAATTDVRAFDLYRRASQPDVRRSDVAVGEALVLLDQALAIDPGFAAAHSEAAVLHLRLGGSGTDDMPHVDRLRLAERHARTATRLDPSLAEAHGSLGIANLLQYHFGDAEEHLGRALELDPGLARTREWMVSLLVFTGRFDAALKEARRAVEADPLSPSARGELGRALLLNGRCDEALAEVLPLTRLDPPLLRAGPIAAQCSGLAGRWDEAVQYAAISARAGAKGNAWLGHFLARAGRRDEAREILAQLEGQWERTGNGAFEVAMVLAGLGQLDDAFDWLRRAARDYSITLEIQEPTFAMLHEDPRFQELLDDLGSDPP